MWLLQWWPDQILSMQLGYPHTRNRQIPPMHHEFSPAALSQSSKNFGRLCRRYDPRAAEILCSGEPSKILIAGHEKIPVIVIMGPIHLPITKGVSPPPRLDSLYGEASIPVALAKSDQENSICGKSTV